MICDRSIQSSESGAALVTTLLVSFLLGTVCIALLTSIAASSRNGTDALTENKAFYAAESGLQAAINVFRYKGVNYTQAVGHPDLRWNATTFPNGITYTNGKVIVNGDSSYIIEVSDPDNSAGNITFSTSGSFKQSDGTFAASRVFGTGSDTLTFTFNPRSSLNLIPGTGTEYGSFQVAKAGNGATMNSAVDFRVDYVLSEPRAATKTIRGTICTDGHVVFSPTICSSTQTTRPTYTLMGSTITLCGGNGSPDCNAVPTLSLPTSPVTSPQTAILYGNETALEPYRLKVTATGYGPNGAVKKLEAIVQRNFFNDLGSQSAISMIGPNAYFAVGTSAQMQISGGSNPAITVSDTTGLNTVLSTMQAHNFNGTITPAPEIAGNDLPDWQQNTTALNNLVSELRTSAQNSGRYFNGTSPTSWGNFSNGTGITFCEGSCTMGGNSSGGGILVVTGTFFTAGNPQFNGLVLAVGQYVSTTNPGGVVRTGGGNEIFTGNIVIAPYDPNNLAAGFGQPRYDQSGGPGDTIQSDVVVDQAFDGTSAITDFVLGVVEK
jgi:hypothetical protein